MKRKRSPQITQISTDFCHGQTRTNTDSFFHASMFFVSLRAPSWLNIKISLCLRVLVAILMVVSVGFVGCKVVVIEELTLNITSAQWFLEHGPGQSDSIRLRIKGDTNGERVTIITYGDGLMNEEELTPDADKEFNQVVTIAFSHVGYTPPVQAETTVKAYRGSESKEVKLQSGNIW